MKEREKKREITSAEGKEVPYPLVPSKKDKERHLARFLDIFKKLEITLPFGEALQQMPLYAKFLKDMLSYPNFVGGPSVVRMRPSFDHFEVFDTHR